MALQLLKSFLSPMETENNYSVSMFILLGTKTVDSDAILLSLLRFGHKLMKYLPLKQVECMCLWINVL